MRRMRNPYLNVKVALHLTHSQMVGIVYGLGVPMRRIGPKGLKPHPKVAYIL